MKILFATSHQYLPQRAGGSESSTHDLATTMLQRGHQVAVMAALDRGGALFVWNRVRSKWQKKRFPTDHKLGYPVYRGWFVVEEAAQGLREVLADFKPDVLVCQAGHPLVFAQTGVASGCPTVVYLRDVEFSHLGGDPRQIPRLHFVSNSTFTAKRFMDVYGLASTVIPPLVKRERYLVQNKGSHVLFVNPLPVKGLETAIALAECNPDIPFLFQESWPLPPEAKQELLVRLDKIPNVKFQNQTQDMRPVYAQAKVLLAPSRWEEAWGRVVTEAQINGIPVLASNRGGLPDAVGNGGVVLAIEAPIEQWSQALRSLWDSAPIYQRFSQAAKRRTEAGDVSENHLANQLEEKLASAVKNKNGF